MIVRWSDILVVFPLFSDFEHAYCILERVAVDLTFCTLSLKLASGRLMREKRNIGKNRENISAH